MLSGVETSPLEETLAVYAARLGPIAAPDPFQGCAEVRSSSCSARLFTRGSCSSTTPPPADTTTRREGAGAGPSLAYRKLEKLERDPLFAANRGWPVGMDSSHVCSAGKHPPLQSRARTLTGRRAMCTVCAEHFAPQSIEPLVEG
jgi:hypothetical protein